MRPLNDLLAELMSIALNAKSDRLAQLTMAIAKASGTELDSEL